MAALALAIPTMATATGTAAGGYDFSSHWPTHHVFDDGTDLGLALKYQYGRNRGQSALSAAPLLYKVDPAPCFPT